MDCSGFCNANFVMLRLHQRVGRARRGVGASRPVNTFWQGGPFLVFPTRTDRHSAVGQSSKPRFSQLVSRARRGTRPIYRQLKQFRRGPASIAEGSAALTSGASSSAPMCGLTLRSRRGPTASHQARQRALFIIPPSGLASCRRSRLNSNVRPRIPAPDFIHVRSHCLRSQQL